MFSTLRRGCKIIRVALHYRLDLLLDSDKLPWHIRIVLLPARLFPANELERGQRIRMALEDLGPIFIKFGQMLSTRPDLIPNDIAGALSPLQDNVTPFGEQQAIDIIEAALGAKIDSVFSQFEQTPMASASIAQVHAATLQQDSLDVVVKVVRPGIEKIIQQDVSMLFSLANFVAKYVTDGERLRPVEVVEEYQHVIADELNMQVEAANTSQLRRNFEHSDLLYVPQVYWDYTRRNVLVMERIYGIPVSDIDALNTKNTNLKVLAERGVEIFFSQVFRDSFFHADMHPGNIFVDASNPETPRYIAIDCAIIGCLDENDQYYLARNLLAIFKREYRTVAELHIECGWVPSHIRAGDFESAIRSVCEPIFEKPLAEISFGQILVYLFTVARRFEMTVQPSLILLQKTLLNVEGLGRQLYPQLDLWQTAMPFLEDWMAKRYMPGSVIQRLQKQAPALLEQLPHIPDMLAENIKHSTQLQTLALSQQKQQLDQQNRRTKQRRLYRALACGLLLVSASLFIDPTNNWLLSLTDYSPAIATAALAIALLVLG